MEVIIPGLPNDIALQCLIRVPFDQIHSLRSVSKTWKSQINLGEFFRLRKSAGKARAIIILSEVHRYTLPRLSVLEPETGLSSLMPPIPDFKQLPVDCRAGIVGQELVVMGGYDRRTKKCFDSVFIFEFSSSTWRRGANLPDGPRTSFACAVYANRYVFVAGGHNGEKNITSTWTYDVAANKWDRLPDMSNDPRMECECYNCQGLIYHDKFNVIKRDPWEIKLEIFDMSAKQWSKTDKSVLDHTSKYCVQGFNGQNLYRIRGSNLDVLEYGGWKFVKKLPARVSLNESHLIASSEYLWLISSEYTSPYKSYKMDLKYRIWISSKVQVKFFGSLDSCHSLII